MAQFVSGAIIAAGRGERLRAATDGLPKPLIMMGGTTLLEYQVREMLEVGVARVHAIVNTETARLMRELSIKMPREVDLCVADTTNSMESLLTLGERITGGRFLLTTVDTIMPDDQWRGFVAAAARIPDTDVEARGHDGALGIVRWRGDARPLFVEMDQTRSLIIGLGDKPGEFVTAGVYAFPTSIFAHTAAARGLGLDALRRFLGFLLERGQRLAAIELHGVVDLDEPADLEAARTVIAGRRAGGETR